MKYKEYEIEGDFKATRLNDCDANIIYADTIEKVMDIVKAVEFIERKEIESEHYFNDWFKEHLAEVLIEYHKEQLTLTDVSPQSELLAFGKWLRDNWKDVWFYKEEFMISEFKKANCS